MRQEQEKQQCQNLPALYREVLDQMGHCGDDFGQAMIEVAYRKRIKLDFRTVEFLVNMESMRLEWERKDFEDEG